MSDPKYIIDARNITKIYGVDGYNMFVALKDASLAMSEGEFICIMGPSGAGKSTFINTVSTIDVPSKGRVFIKGDEVRTFSSGKMGKFRYENLGFIFQNFNLIDSITVAENIAMPLTLHSVDKAKARSMVEEIAEKVGISMLLEKLPGECSGGQRQRIAIARALVNHPKLIIADEPTGNLDSKNSHEILELFKRLNEEGSTILMVTHDSKIASYSTKLVYLKDGNIETVIERGDMTQKEYFYKIVDINSRESQELMDS